MCIFIERNWLQRTGSCNYGGWDTQRSVVGRLETPDSKLRPEDWESQWKFKSRSQQQAQASKEQLLQDESAIRERLMFQLKAGQLKEEFSLTFVTPAFFLLFRLSTDLTRATIRRAIHFIQCLTDLNVSVIQNTLTGVLRIMLDQISGHSVVQSSWHVKWMTTNIFLSSERISTDSSYIYVFLSLSLNYFSSFLLGSPLPTAFH